LRAAVIVNSSLQLAREFKDKRVDFCRLQPRLTFKVFGKSHRGTRAHDIFWSVQDNLLGA
jgi:very-short-patch-repair endonuclease